MIFPDDLIVGDTLLYAGPSLIDLGIEWKEGDDVAHIEIYAGNGQSWASRNGIGVNIYPFRTDGLKYVRRLCQPFDEETVNIWFINGVRGMKYGWDDVWANVNITGYGSSSPYISRFPGVDCSHFAAALYEISGVAQFDMEFPKNKITPRDFKLSLNSHQIYP
jgi:hypothetical protein